MDHGTIANTNLLPRHKGQQYVHAAKRCVRHAAYYFYLRLVAFISNECCNRLFASRSLCKPTPCQSDRNAAYIFAIIHAQKNKTRVSSK